MRLLLLSNGKDNGGNGSALKRALDRHTDWDVRYVRRQPSFLGYQKDIEWPRNGDARIVHDLFGRADVVMMLGSFRLAQSMPGYESKPKVMYHLGEEFRLNAEAYMARCRAEGIVQLVTTFDLLGYGPELAWLPMVCDTERMRHEREAYRPGPRVRVMQSPAARGPNDTDEFLAAMAGADVEVSLIEGVTWAEALRRKAQADIVFDSFDSWYGLSAIEAMGMGIPVVGGQGPVMGPMAEIVGCVPYLPVTPDNVRHAVMELADSASLREGFADEGRAVVEQFHAEAKVVERLMPFLEMARDYAVAA
jgi:glycosyltransferase involved in cell wall biosynthesis